MCLSNAPTLPFVSLFLTGSFFCLENHDGAPAATATSPLSKRKVFGGWVLSFFLFLQKKKKLDAIVSVWFNARERKCWQTNKTREKFCLILTPIILSRLASCCLVNGVHQKKRKKKRENKICAHICFLIWHHLCGLVRPFLFFLGGSAHMVAACSFCCCWGT